MTAPVESLLLAVDLGGSHLRVAVANRAGAILGRASDLIGPGPEPQAIVERISHLAASLVTGASVAAIGVSCPGVIDPDTGVVLGARNLGWRDVPLGEMLSQRLGCPARIENDVNLAVVGERWRGAGQAFDDLAFLGVGTGVGIGVVLGGTLQRGAQFGAGEVNALPSGIRNETGGELSIEDVAAGPAILRRARVAGLPAEALTTERVFALAAAGDPRATGVVRDAVSALALAIAWTVALVDPALIVVGGGVAAQGQALLAPLRDRVTRLVRLRAKIVAAGLGEDAQLYGALHEALRIADEGA